jgi:hypothetical protein
MTRKILLIPAVLTLAFAAISSALAVQGRHGFEREDEEANAVYAIGLWGDLPYSDIQASVGVPNLIADTNSQHLAFTVHDADLKQGSNSSCDDALHPLIRLFQIICLRAANSTRRLRQKEG